MAYEGASSGWLRRFLRLLLSFRGWLRLWSAVTFQDSTGLRVKFNSFLSLGLGCDLIVFPKLSFDFAYEGLERGNRVAQVQVERASMIDACGHRVLVLFSVNQLKSVLIVIFRLFLGLANRIHRYFDRVIDHLRHKNLHVFAWCAQVRIRIDFNQPYPEVFVEQKVEPKNFKAISAIVRVHLVPHGQEAVYNDVFHSWHKVLLNSETVLGVLGRQVLLKLFEGQRVAFLVSAVAVELYLQALIGQMNSLVIVAGVVGGARGSKVALTVDIDAVVVSDERPNANVELALLV